MDLFLVVLLLAVMILAAWAAAAVLGATYSLRTLRSLARLLDTFDSPLPPLEMDCPRTDSASITAPAIPPPPPPPPPLLTWQWKFD